jgi:transposase
MISIHRLWQKRCVGGWLKRQNTLMINYRAYAPSAPSLINMDNGPENDSHRTHFMNRLVEYLKKNEVKLSLVYYSPYHSKYKSIEQVWGVLENHRKGQLLDSAEKTMGLSITMTYSDKKPVAKLRKQNLLKRHKANPGSDTESRRHN